MFNSNLAITGFIRQTRMIVFGALLEFPRQALQTPDCSGYLINGLVGMRRPKTAGQSKMCAKFVNPSKFRFLISWNKNE
ncbi:MAG: hypothetical protein CTY34_08175 [Methylobacter sp.]|nr:MAG: hypothetical protein CTY34_08175 [Methylobacter sp.]PPD18163.1 MAG: hypothetical protein CTY24_13510 [Methylobacter sp.]PPD33960.1 MAG: hypothetical protein CTY18_09080 [Methylomonas sp.]